MIYFLSDQHGGERIGELTKYLAEAKDTDLLIILGDLGLRFKDTEENRAFDELILTAKKKIAFIDGNHENYGYIASFPEEEWCGGRVNRISERIVYLKRGEIYDIKGKSVFTFGGCKSSSKWQEKGLVYEGEDPTPDEVARAMENLRAHGNKVDFVLTHKHERGIDPTISESLMELTSYIEDNVEYKRWCYGHWHCEKDVDGKHRVIYKELRELR